MSLDTIDDLHEAEEVAGDLGRMLRQVREHCSFAELPQALEALSRWENYCRPSCGFLEDGHCATGDTDVCGCPCAHDDTAAAPSEYPDQGPPARLAR